MPIAINKKRKHELRCGRFLLGLGERTHLMGILNRTPDSFSDGGKFMNETAALNHVRKMVNEGADIIDIGGESTRPGSGSAGLSEELNRTVPIIKKISQEMDVPVSIDTSKHEVAREAIKAGASMVNDITGLKADPKMAHVISDSGVAISVMHIKGAPKDMQDNPIYNDLMLEIIESLEESIDIALGAGVSPDKIIVDPGIGFGKTTEHNLTIINRLSDLEILDKPILIGPSRKSFIGRLLNKEVPERLMGTAATCALSILKGANIIRVHDIKEMVDVARMADAVKGSPRHDC
ncbi:MAG: dihydropteroate synthase [Candidatus Omnitrophica bacterium]|nr:dihydropteroate synthase [Candidatus Omnitrophota bacterium]